MQKARLILTLVIVILLFAIISLFQKDPPVADREEDWLTESEEREEEEMELMEAEDLIDFVSYIQLSHNTIYTDHTRAPSQPLPYLQSTDKL